MKLVYVINSIQKNGPSEVLANIISGLENSSNEISVITFLNNDEHEEARLSNLGAQVVNLNISKKK